MTAEPNTQVMQLWRQQSQMLDRTPELVAEHVAEIGVYLTTLYDRAVGSEDLTRMIQSTWSKVQGIQTLVSTQTTALTSASIIIPALKIQRDELAVEISKLLEAMGLADESSGPIQGMLSALYEGWREALDTNDIEAASQDEMLSVIYGDIESVWGLEEGDGDVVIGALRGHTDLNTKQEKAFKAFLRSLAGDA
jgi:hypothetical protein